MKKSKKLHRVINKTLSVLTCAALYILPVLSVRLVFGPHASVSVCHCVSNLLNQNKKCRRENTLNVSRVSSTGSDRSEGLKSRHYDQISFISGNSMVQDVGSLLWIAFRTSMAWRKWWRAAWCRRFCDSLPTQQIGVMCEYPHGCSAKSPPPPNSIRSHITGVHRLLSVHALLVTELGSGDAFVYAVVLQTNVMWLQ